VKQPIVHVDTRPFWLVACALTATSACDFHPTRNDAKPTRAASSSPRRAPRIVPVHMPDAIPQQNVAAAASAVITPTPLKSTGKVGELLESDVYFFKVRSLRTCDASGKVAGVEVEIEAKTKLAVSPRDVVIGKGGITFTAGLNFERKLPGCTPLLGLSVLQKGQVARGFVLFDVPRPPGSDLTLIYQPTRWGGAGYVSVPLQTWSGPP
jgi:hypothetical protein